MPNFLKSFPLQNLEEQPISMCYAAFKRSICPMTANPGLRRMKVLADCNWANLLILDGTGMGWLGLNLKMATVDRS